jgi:hypothetical protein
MIRAFFAPVFERAGRRSSYRSSLPITDGPRVVLRRYDNPDAARCIDLETNCLIAALHTCWRLRTRKWNDKVLIIIFFDVSEQIFALSIDK